MKRFLLFAIMCVCVSIGAWADSMGSNGSTYTVETTASHSLKKLTINSEHSSWRTPPWIWVLGWRREGEKRL